MIVEKTGIEGLILIRPEVYRDERGYFLESFSQRVFEDKVNKTFFVQDNESKSKYGVLRGLHFQKPPFAQAKLVRVISGKVLDVAVDLRHNSPTFGKHYSVELSDENHVALHMVLLYLVIMPYVSINATIIMLQIMQKV